MVRLGDQIFYVCAMLSNFNSLCTSSKLKTYLLVSCVLVIKDQCHVIFCEHAQSRTRHEGTKNMVSNHKGVQGVLDK